MRRSSKARRILAAIIISLLAAMGSSAALADGTPVSECDALEQGVVLYEEMTGAPVEYPAQLAEGGYDDTFLKSVTMGYVNLDDFGNISGDEYIRKQDFMNILYKTIITYNPDFAIDGAETEQILNDCFDNAYLDEENRTAYAFMIKEGLITDMLDSQPNSELTWDGCSIMVDLAYRLFVNGESVAIGGEEFKIGDNIESVMEKIGMPNRIDASDYGFDWYVYNGDYSRLVMLGVDGDRICAFFTNAAEFDYRGIKAGDDFAKIAPYINSNLRVITDGEDKIDSVMYNPRGKEINYSPEARQARANELLDIINANRIRNKKSVYSDGIPDADALLTSVDAESEHDIASETGYDIFEIYSNMVRSGARVIDGESLLASPMGVSVSVDRGNDYSARLVRGRNSLPAITARQPMQQQPEIEEQPVKEVKEVTTPVVVSPEYEQVYDDAENVVLELAMQAAEQYHLEVFDYENDDYVVNKYITTDDLTFTLPGELFTPGRDYTIIISALGEDGTALSADPILISYGAKYDDSIRLTSPYNDGITDDDVIAVTWESEEFSDFYIDLYNLSGELIVSEVVENEKEALIRGVDPGEYYLYVTALRKGTLVEKAQAMTHFTVVQPEPVINEIILAPDEVYNFVYEDEALGVLYFYDEDIVDMEDENGEIVQRKKIIQKKVKATKAYRRLANYIERKESTTGAVNAENPALPFDATMGDAIVAEAEKYLDVPYVWGGTSPSGFDCSGLVQYVCNSLGISVNRVAEDQFQNGVPVNRDELMPGDLIFFEENGYIHHVGIYAGNNMMIHAPHTGDVVRYASLDNAYYQREYAGARRVY